MSEAIPTKQEFTSAEVAGNAARIMKMTDSQLVAYAVHSAPEIRSVAASALTQARPRKKFLGIF